MYSSIHTYHNVSLICLIMLWAKRDRKDSPCHTTWWMPCWSFNPQMPTTQRWHNTFKTNMWFQGLFEKSTILIIHQGENIDSFSQNSTKFLLSYNHFYIAYILIFQHILYHNSICIIFSLKCLSTWYWGNVPTACLRIKMTSYDHDWLLTEFEFKTFLDCDNVWLVERWVMGDVWVRVSTLNKGGGGMWKRDQHSLFFFLSPIWPPPPPTFLIKYVFPILMFSGINFFFFWFTCNKVLRRHMALGFP